ncbi:ninein [Folsomia candida]|uniref:Ninein-like protein n=1 Tax=Folsomia candida TaxID=158441 RepID=A0A226DCT7_FOLCA|nr:ninein [Folsomia candida]OXA42644.1 Ninein-like protein [Folsomia candida]
MGEEFEPDQLVEFCQRLGLANDGYLDEKELAIVCNCIGLQAPEEMLKELFETLDTDKDGRVCLDELSQMLRGMPKNPASPEKHKKPNDSTTATTGNGGPSSSSRPVDFSSNVSIANGDRASFSILDPNCSGFTTSGLVLDMWSQWGIGPTEGLSILKDLGFPVSSKTCSINVYDLTKALEEETDSAKDALSPVIQTALLTYKTETQYLRSICESMEGERDKLRSDIFEAHQRSSLLAQEVDEQNARLEKNGQILLQKMEAKYAEQLHELQVKFGSEKESLQQALYLAESQLKSLAGDDSKLKGHITKLNNENSALERELQTLNKEIRNLNKAKTNLEADISRYVDLENKLLEIERRSSETTAINEAKLREAHEEVTLLRDQNDELSAHVETMREKVKTLKAFHEKARSTNKRRKGSASASGSKSLSLEVDDRGGGGGLDDTDNEYPLEKKMGKFHLHLGPGCGDVTMLSSDEVEELETSLANSCGASEPDSGNFPALRAINLSACLGETSTDSPVTSIMPPDDYGSNTTLERELETVQRKIDSTILVENKKFHSLKHEIDNSASSEKFGREAVEVATQTMNTDDHSKDDVDMEDMTKDGGLAQLTSRIAQLESDAIIMDKERRDLRDTCTDLELSLDLLREEYEKCEDYWHDKLTEAREIYESDKSAMDEKFQDLLTKIKEYEETFINSSSISNYQPMRLPPIEERANLEQQVTELEDECEGLRRELRSLKVEQDSIISNYQRQWESRAMEECSRLEQQVSVLTKKCHEYENRLSSLAEEERSTLDSSGLLDMLRDRVRQLEFQLKHQEDQFRTQISQLEEREKKAKMRDKTRRSCSPRIETKNYSSASNIMSSSPQPPQSLPAQMWNSNNNNNNSQEAVDLNGTNLLGLLQNQTKKEEVQGEENKDKLSPFQIWPQRHAHKEEAMGNSKSASLPFIPVPVGEGGGEQYPTQQNLPFSTHVWNNPSSQSYQQHPVFSDPWTPHTQNGINGRKAWCHVELGWLQALRARLRQRENQCHALQRALKIKEIETDKVITEMRYQRDTEAAHWSHMMQANQDLLCQQATQYKEQGSKLAQSELVMKNLWVENGKLRTALNSTEQRVLQLENLLKYHMSLQNQQLQPPKPDNHSPRSLPFNHQPNFTM